MSFHGSCPRCGTELKTSSEGVAPGFTLCECGWYESANVRNTQLETEKRSIIVMVVAAVLFSGLFMHAVNWGSHWHTIPFTKLGQMTGTLSQQGYQDLAQVCIQLNKWACAKGAYTDAYRKTGNPANLAMLARFQVRLGEVDGAVSTYEVYFKAGGRDGDASLEFAKLLEERGQADRALQFYESSIAARPAVLPIKATTAIVRLLMKQGKYDDAHARITDFHQSAENAKGYLNVELQQLDNYMRAQAKDTVVKKTAQKKKA